LAKAIPDCRACDLYEGATQAVIGEGVSDARLMLVGEQPADREDIEGHPFVGPAGRVLDRGLDRGGIARDDVYITNVVKHFRYKARGKRRIHQRPDRWQINACLPWLEAEISVVQHRGHGRPLSSGPRQGRAHEGRHDQSPRDVARAAGRT
jgi:uracil-DNA glycosylase family protein